MERCTIANGILSLMALAALGGTAQANPSLTPGVWQQITPASVPTGDPATCIGQGITLDPANPSTIFWCNTPYGNDTYGGIYKSTDAGSTWKRIGADSTDPNAYDSHAFLLNDPLRLRIDPANPLHMYANVGVRGNLGFWISTDGGAHWNEPDAFVAWAAATGTSDVYEVSVDPADFNHLLLSFHSGWQNGVDAGILESKDGGSTWITHRVDGSGTAGKSIDFLYDPALGIGNGNTWLMGTQNNGYWRTSDGGATWQQVVAANVNVIDHGGSNVTYTKNKMLYVPGGFAPMRSSDNGVTWSLLSSVPQHTWCVFSDGATLYTGINAGNQAYYVSPESDGLTWKAYNSQTFLDGPYDMVLDSTNRIIYSSNWSSGVWALKLPPSGTTGIAAFKPLPSAAEVGTRAHSSRIGFRIPAGLPGAEGLYDAKGILGGAD